MYELFAPFSRDTLRVVGELPLPSPKEMAELQHILACLCKYKEDEVKQLLAAFASGTLDEKIKEEEREEEKKRIRDKYIYRRLDGVVLQTYNGPYGCKVMNVNLVKDVDQGTECFRGIATYVRGRIGDVVYLVERLTATRFNLYAWDTSDDGECTEPIYTWTTVGHTDWSYFCMNDPYAVCYHPVRECSRIGRWEYHFSTDREYVFLVVQDPKTSTRIASFELGEYEFGIYTLQEDTGMLTVSTSESTVMFDLTELERDRVDVLEPWLTRDWMRNHLLSFLVLETRWAWRQATS
jgi:hypothetical protein